MWNSDRTSPGIGWRAADRGHLDGTQDVSATDGGGGSRRDRRPRTRARGGARSGPAAARRTAPRPRSGSGEKIVLVQNAWTASAINVAIAKNLIEENLGNEVELTAIDENTMFAGLADGDLDACLELWPSGISADEQKYLDDGDVVEIGLLGAVGRIGWYVPDYVQEQYPETATWEAFTDPELCKLVRQRRRPATSAASSAPTRRTRKPTRRSSPTSASRSRSITPAPRPPPWPPSTRPCRRSRRSSCTGGSRPQQQSSTTSSRWSCPSTPRSATPTRRESTARTRRTCCSRSRSPAWPRRTPRSATSSPGSR